MEERLYGEESYAIRGAIFDVYREMGSGFVEPLELSEGTGMRLGLLVNFGRCGGRTKDSINLDFFRVDPCVPWLKNWFRMDMHTAFGTVVCLLGWGRLPSRCTIALCTMDIGPRSVRRNVTVVYRALMWNSQ